MRSSQSEISEDACLCISLETRKFEPTSSKNASTESREGMDLEENKQVGNELTDASVIFFVGFWI